QDRAVHGVRRGGRVLVDGAAVGDLVDGCGGNHQHTVRVDPVAVETVEEPVEPVEVGGTVGLFGTVVRGQGDHEDLRVVGKLGQLAVEVQRAAGELCGEMLR